MNAPITFSDVSHMTIPNMVTIHRILAEVDAIKYPKKGCWFFFFFTVSIWERVEPELVKEGSKMLMLALFGISDPFERVIKIILKVVMCIYTGSMEFCLCTGFSGDWTYMGQIRVKKVPKILIWLIWIVFDFLTTWCGSEYD